MPRAESATVVLDAHAHPYVARPIELAGKLREPLRPLREDLIRVLWRRGHRVEHPSDEVERDLRVAGSLMLLTKIMRGARQCFGISTVSSCSVGAKPGPLVRGSPSLVLGLAHRLEPRRQSEGVAVVAARRSAVAAGGGVPRRLGPLDGGTITHVRSV